MLNVRNSTNKMGINLALSRVNALLQAMGNPHINSYKSIHVAGTNGKGSTVTYISSILSRAQIRNGRFTSPHLLYYNDCISINNETYPLNKYETIARMVRLKNETQNIGCTEFELLTVTAFKIFEVEEVEYAVIEVGLGGRLDATNVLLPHKPDAEYKGGVILCGITKIGIDHELFLGTTFAEIAGEKAGIIKLTIPCVVDSTNNDEVLKVIKEKASLENSALYPVDGMTNSFDNWTLEQVHKLRSESPLKGNYQLQNLSVALKLIELLNHKSITKEIIQEGVKKVVWPGRLQSVTYKGLPLLIDGAHNESAALELKQYLDTLRNEHGIIFIVALSKGKSIENLLKYINNPSDAIIACKFTRPDGMPWVKSCDVQDIQMVAKTYFNEILDSSNDNSVSQVLDQVLEMKNKGDQRKVVVCGSLYLCSDVLRLVDN